MTPHSHWRVALITPVRDEEMYIGEMIESIAAQQNRPAKWVIVDDGSTDQTPEIIASYARRHSFIHLVQRPPRRERKAGGESAITHALSHINLAEFDFLARFDADLVFEKDYLTGMLQEFSSDATLGIAGGGLYVRRNGGSYLETAPEYHVRGALKMYRRECFTGIGGLSTQIGWDTIDEVSAWTKGWKTKSFFQYRVIHRRPTGQGIKLSRICWERGKAEYLTWSHPAFVLTKSLKVARETRSLSAPLCFLAGFVWPYCKGYERRQDRAFVKARREQQIGRMTSALKERSRLIIRFEGSQRPVD
jgi:biofilm PGA synthesis N-glycosyltransferase PgaC